MSLLPSLLLALCAGAAVVIGGHRLARATGPWGRPARVVSTVWVPLLMVAPALGVVRGTLDPWTSAAITVGPAVAAVCSGLIVVAHAVRGLSAWQADDRFPLSWPAVGVLLLVLAVAGVAPEVVALAVFAIGAVLAWMETIPGPDEHYGGPGIGWLALAVIGGVVLAATCMWSVSPGPPLAVAMGAGGLLCLGVARTCGPRMGIIAGGWAAVLGATLGTGMSSQISAATFVAGVGPVAPPGRVEHLDALVVPGLLLLCLCGVVAGAGRWGRPWQVVTGLGLLVMGGLGGMWALSMPG